ncbi:MAG: hypothetical protein HYX74_02690 [Acidobacteria bacterium]|nr:hypothetical protein [Acidobacteriota bacterium]
MEFKQLFHPCCILFPVIRHRGFFVCFFLCAFSVTAARSEPGLYQVWRGGPPDKRINLVFLSEGYTESQLPQFLRDVHTVWDYLVTVEPFAEYRNYFNTFAVSVASAESGSDHPSVGIFRDTYFNSSFESYGLSRALTIPPNDRDPNPVNGYEKAYDLLDRLLPEWNLIVFLVNDPNFGGWGDKKGAISSASIFMPATVAHELGHSFGGLNDEYPDPFPEDPDPVVEEPNTTRETRREFIKWRAWILPSTPVPTPLTHEYVDSIGLFEGARFQSMGWYRPKLTCKMRAIFSPFCEVCREALVLSVYRRVRPVENIAPLFTPISIRDAESIAFSITPMVPSNHSLKIQWFLDGINVPTQDATGLVLQGHGLTQGIHELKVEVIDDIAMVRTDPENLLKQSISWTVLKFPRSRRLP